MEVDNSLQPNSGVEPRYFLTSPGKFIAMSLCTFGLYEIFWSYKNWRFVKDRDSSAIMPFWRAMFFPLWHYSLLTELNKTLKSKNLSSSAYRGLLAMYVLILGAVWRLPDPYWLVSFLTFIGFLPAVFAMRTARPAGAIQEQREYFHPSNLIAYGLGGPIFAVIALSSVGFFPSTAVVVGDDLWDRDIEYLLETGILAPDEEIAYFYSLGLWSIAEDGQFFSDSHVTSYGRDPETGETNLYYAAFSDISDINVTWAESFLDDTVVTITHTNDQWFELWLSNEGEGDRKFVDALIRNWNKRQRAD